MSAPQTLSLGAIYRNAARLIEQGKNEGNGCCAAIWRAQGEPPKPGALWQRSRNYQTLAHQIFGRYCAWENGTEKFGDWAKDRIGWDQGSPEAHDHRVVFLCILAAMASVGDLDVDIAFFSIVRAETAGSV